MRTTVNSTKIIKQANEHLVLAALHKNEPISVEDIMSITRLSRPTVLNIIKGLDAKELIVKAGLGESIGGRQPYLYTLNLNKYFAVGIDLEYPPVRIAFSDLKGKILFTQSWENGPGDTMQNIQDNLVEAIRAGMRRLNIISSNLIGIGLGIPGQVNINNNQATRMDRMKQWKHEDIAAYLSKEIGVQVLVRNDIHLLAASECRFQPTHPDTFLYIARRVGIGMSVFIAGKSYEGNFGNSGYIGHMVMNSEGDVCHCGKRGCLEQYATTHAIEKSYAKQKKLDGFVSYEDILLAAQHNEPQAQKVLHDAAVKMAEAIAAAIQLFDIQTAILGDWENDDSDYFFSLVKQNIEKLVSLSADTTLTILKGKLTSRAYALGGCLIMLNKFFKAPQLKLDS